MSKLLLCYSTTQEHEMNTASLPASFATELLPSSTRAAVERGDPEALRSLGQQLFP